MSMISAQIDELRRMADGQATYREARAVMLQAADTILELRKDLEFADNECEKESIEFLNLQAENAKLRELVSQMYSDMQGVLDMSTDTVWVDSIGTLRDRMDYHMQDMAELGMPPADYEKRMRELGIEVAE